MACLVPGSILTFTELKEGSGLADGNLHVQTRRLAAARYLEIIKVSRGARSLTRFRITELGVEALKLHVRKLQTILASEATGVRRRPVTGRDDGSQVWS